MSEHSHDCCAAEAAAPSVPVDHDGLTLHIPAMDCPTEEGQIRAALEPLTGIRHLHFDLAARALSVDAPAALWPAVIEAIQAAGFKAETLSAPPSAAEGEKLQRRELIKLVVALLLALAAELLHFFAPQARLWDGLGMAVAAVAIGFAGLTVLGKGLGALRRFQLNINALMSVAVIGAFLLGQWPEAAMVMALYSLAELIESRSVERARNAIAGLLALTPPQVELRAADGEWRMVDAAAAAVGATARVKPGERFALDGRVTVGHSVVDQSPVTGESMPVDKGPGDEVYAGTINQGGALAFEVTKPAGDTVLARIIHAVEDAQATRAPMQRFVDRFAAVYTPSVFLLALAVALGGPLLAGWSWGAAVYKALVLLVIACPCALVISTPVTLVSGLAAAARRGILIKGGVYLEQARRLRFMALDKTGTLTEGRPRLVATQVLATDRPEAEVLAAALGLALRSDHPVSKAVAAGLAATQALELEGFAAEPGRGIRGHIAGKAYQLGNHRWMEELGLCGPALEALLSEQELQGRTVTLLADSQQVLALFAVADACKPSSREAIEALRRLGIEPVMLTGDNQLTAQGLAAQLGITEVHATLLPEDKLAWVRKLSARGPVGMVGDGINDGPALSAAAVGFSLGAAVTDTAKEAADVLVMNDDLRRVPEMLRLSRRTHALLWQNITLALGLKALFFVLAVFGSATMWMAVFADMGASLLVVFNGLRLLRGAEGLKRRQQP